MSFDTSTRNRLASFVGKCRAILCGDFKTPGGEMARLLAHYGIQDTGECFEVDSLTHLDEPGRETAHTLRELLAHKQANSPSAQVWGKFDPAVYDLIQEQGFTVLNRLCALRMAEERKILQFPCISKGLQSDGFELYEYHTGKANADISKEDRFQHFIFSLFDELSLDLGSLFDRFNPQGLIFPEPSVLNELLEEINHPDLAPLWAEDETIGWIYQYWNSKEERKAMRDASAAPRNSRELAVRNQFFTPRYVVEFLTDNTLGRIWYEMTKGQTRLAEQCRYLVRRPTEIFLGEGEEPPAENEEQSTKNQELSQEELLRQPVHIPHRPAKDPREIRLLDPACGSMHFGLYAFDLFEAIYEEAWDLMTGEAADQIQHSTFNTQHSRGSLTDLYASKQEYMLDVPRLIIENNIHGVDIDPRAVQIAGLSLWLRAQKTWKDTPAAERPRVRRSNIVCAEPMPGSDAMLEDFLQTLDPPLLGELVKTVFDKMQLAGEAGTLLKIEEEIRTAIDDAKAKWEKLGAAERDLFSAEELNQTLRPGTQQELTRIEKALTTDHRPLATDFFDTAEERIYAALRDYAESAEAGDYQRRLFAEDAAHGFAFIDLSRRRYDAVVMNPPFGESAKPTKSYLKHNYKFSHADIFQAFVERMLTLLLENGREGVLSARTGFFLGASKKWRENVVFKNRIPVFADLGLGVLDDALVEVAAYVLEAGEPGSNSVFTSRQLDTREKGEGLLNDIHDASPKDYFDQSLIKIIPDYTFAYWAPAELLRRYAEPTPFSSVVGKVRQGTATADDFRFARLGWEVPELEIGQGMRWPRFTKGGSYSPFIDDIHLVVEWSGDGAQMKCLVCQRYPYLNGNWSFVVKNASRYFRPGASYARRTASAFTARALPQGCIFSDLSQVWFGETSDTNLTTIGYFSSRFAQSFIELGVGGGDIATSGSAARRYTTAVVEGVPSEVIPRLNTNSNLELLRNIWSVRAKPLLSDETSTYFADAIHKSEIESLSKNKAQRAIKRLEELASALDDSGKFDACVSLEFGLTSSEVQYVDAEIGLHPTSYAADANYDEVGELLQLEEDELVGRAVSQHGPKRWFTKKSFFIDRKLEIICHLLKASPATVLDSVREQGVSGDSASYAQEIVSQLVGITLGRWDIRYATGERQPPELPDPFDPLPVCPPGMLQNAEGLPAAPSDVPDDYPLPITWPGILVSDPGHPEDIVARVRDALAVIWGDRSAAIEQEACEILGVRTLREYFAEKKSGGKFFKDHLKRYSKSRRQAPIYWPLSTESGTYTLWIYYHRLTENSLYSAVTQFIEPKQEDVAKTYANLSAKKDRTKTEDKELEAAQLLVAELATFRESLLEIAKLWKPNLNDGVQITAAPLWKHFRLKTWQKKLKDTWQKLEKGEYDWAHLAHSTWPERVIPKCLTDRSLAIAHGHDEALWEEVKNDKGKLVWQPKKDAEEIAQALVANA